MADSGRGAVQRSAAPSLTSRGSDSTIRNSYSEIRNLPFVGICIPEGPADVRLPASIRTTVKAHFRPSRTGSASWKSGGPMAGAWPRRPPHHAGMFLCSGCLRRLPSLLAGSGARTSRSPSSSSQRSRPIGSASWLARFIHIGIGTYMRPSGRHSQGSGIPARFAPRVISVHRRLRTGLSLRL